MPHQRCRSGDLARATRPHRCAGLRAGRRHRPRYRALVLLGAFGSLRWGELAALRRCDIDLAAGTIRVDRQLTLTTSGGQQFGLPKSSAGRRVVPVPAMIVPELTQHMSQYTQDHDAALIFTSPNGTLLRHSNFMR